MLTRQNLMKRKYLVTLGSLIVIAAVLILAFIKVESVRSGPQASTPTPTYGVDLNVTVMPPAMQPKITDLAPNIPYEDKPSVVVQHADGSKERYLLAPEMLDAFIKNLPKGDNFLGDIPPPSLMVPPAFVLTPEESDPLIMRSGIPLKVTDLSPDMDDAEKGTLIIRHANGSEEAFLIAPDQVDQFISQLSKEDKLVQIISPGSIEDAHP